MVGFKRRYPTRYGGPSKSTKTSYSSSLSMAKQLASIKRRVSMYKPEVKALHTTASISNVAPGAGALQLLTGLDQGTDNGNRLGSTVRPKYMELNLIISDSLGSSSLDNFAFYLVKDSTSSGAAPAISGAANAIFSGFGPITGLVQPNTRDRFKVLREYHFNAAEITLGTKCTFLKWRVPMSGLIEYVGTTSAQASAQKNHMYFVVLSDDTAAVLDVQLGWTFSFTDA